MVQFRIFRLLEHVGRRLLQPLYQIDFIWKRTKRAKRICEINMFIRELITKVRIYSWAQICFLFISINSLPGYTKKIGNRL